MKRKLILYPAFGALLMMPAPLASQSETGRVQGRVTRHDGSGVGGVSIMLNETFQTTITDPNGNFAFSGVPTGTYSLTMVLGSNFLAISDVGVAAGTTTNVEQTVEWEVGFQETLTVFAASRRLERVVDAPVAVSIVTEREIERKASTGQLPKLLEFTPGAEVTQSGLYDYNVNARGFNSSLTRRVATLIDGRDPSIPFLGAQEWAAVSFPLDDLESAEMVRGPSAALYGANASSGVLNLTSRSPRHSRGGLVRIAGGELGTLNLDFRWAGALSNGWYVKAVGGLRSSGDFSVSRMGAAEYSAPCAPGQVGDCLPQEAVPLARLDDDDIYFGGVRFDKYIGEANLFTFEGGIADVAGPLFQTGIGRIQVLDVQRPWARFNYSSDHFNLLGYYSGRDAPRQLSLSSGGNIALDTYHVHFEGQSNWDLAQESLRLVVGASARFTDIDSGDPDGGRQTLLFEPVSSDQQAVFFQGDWDATDRLKLVVAGRFDASSLHDSQFSPKGSLVFKLLENSTLRFTYNEAFQVANFSEFFLQVDAAPPVDLSGLNAFCEPFEVDCGFGLTRILALGNRQLQLEKIKTWEVGYSGIIADLLFLTLDYYNSQADDFITDLLPQLGTSLGRVNPRFGPWEGPEGLPPAVEQAIRDAAPPTLSNNVNGTNILAVASYTNFGTVDTQGVDVGLSYYFLNDWALSFAYSWFHFEIQEELPGFDTLLLPNSPENKLSTGISYDGDRLDGSFSLRWVDDFRWGVGPFQGDVEAYTTVDLVANYAVLDHWTVGLNVANLFDNEHWESFGGDLLGRRALVDLAYDW